MVREETALTQRPFDRQFTITGCLERMLLSRKNCPRKLYRDRRRRKRRRKRKRDEGL
jgi:hypothetical protein